MAVRNNGRSADATPETVVRLAAQFPELTLAQIIDLSEGRTGHPQLAGADPSRLAQARGVNLTSDPFLAPATAAELLGVGTATLARWAKAGELPAIRLPDGQRRYRLIDIATYLDRSTGTERSAAPVRPAVAEHETSPPIGSSSPEALIRPTTAAALLGISLGRLTRWADAGKLAPIRTPKGQRRYRLHDITRLVAAQDPADVQTPVESQGTEDSNL